jgi:hypothetical protein
MIDFLRLDEISGLKVKNMACVAPSADMQTTYTLTILVAGCETCQ